MTTLESSLKIVLLNRIDSTLEDAYLFVSKTLRAQRHLARLAKHKLEVRGRHPSARLLFGSRVLQTAGQVPITFKEQRCDNGDPNSGTFSRPKSKALFLVTS
jgi:hypothetical protein